jgi:hypothetical protein
MTTLVALSIHADVVRVRTGSSRVRLSVAIVVQAIANLVRGSDSSLTLDRTVDANRRPGLARRVVIGRLGSPALLPDAIVVVRYIRLLVEQTIAVVVEAIADLRVRVAGGHTDQIPRCLVALELSLATVDHAR